MREWWVILQDLAFLIATYRSIRPPKSANTHTHSSFKEVCGNFNESVLVFKDEGKGMSRLDSVTTRHSWLILKGKKVDILTYLDYKLEKVVLVFKYAHEIADISSMSDTQVIIGILKTPAGF